ncbi:hypothetical protein NBH00_02255 [Paraconexibacter antarcticus]|uniref:Uncharacterized protein n=1 Tax=Paraconexibacter antarcticus TaxID=2949664 RepID=A0ABY5DVF1_9ACTN|nr:hypothetical protein [Paraconexibacter antarcticus]UTI65041.1 hypothetical protein NBH00_02255 [Paraconexibacter antarcticus]
MQAVDERRREPGVRRLLVAGLEGIAEAQQVVGGEEDGGNDRPGGGLRPCLDALLRASTAPARASSRDVPRAREHEQRAQRGELRPREHPDAEKRARGDPPARQKPLDGADDGKRRQRLGERVLGVGQGVGTEQRRRGRRRRPPEGRAETRPEHDEPQQQRDRERRDQQ